VPAVDVSLGDRILRQFVGRSVGWYDLAPSLIRACGLTRGVEVGVWQGTLSRILIELSGVEHLTLVDEWMVRRYCTGQAVITQGPGYTQQEMENAAGLVQLFACHYPEQVTILRMSSLQAAQRIPDRSVEFVILDASHDLNSVRDDLEAWESKIRPGGMFLGDDYDGDFPGVGQAVRERYGDTFEVIGPMWFRSM
jgi:hypothetical protein